MGVLDAPAPIFTWFDLTLLSPLSAIGRLVVWGGVAAAVSMAIYWAASPQTTLTRVVARSRQVRRRLAGFDGDWPHAKRLILESLELSARHLGLVLLPALTAGVPALSLIVWLESAYGYRVSPDLSNVEARPSSAEFRARLVDGPPDETAAGTLVVSDGSGRTLLELPLSTPARVVHKRQWWNWVFGNPAGYLPNGLALDRVEIQWPPVSYLSFGPAWLRTWHAVFLTSLLIFSMVIKSICRIH